MCYLLPIERKGFIMTTQEMIDAGMVDVQVCPPGKAYGIPRPQMRVRQGGGGLARKAAKYAVAKARDRRNNRQRQEW